METDEKIEKQATGDPFEEIKELKDFLEINGIQRMKVENTGEYKQISEEDNRSLKSLLRETFEELRLCDASRLAGVDISLSFSHILPKHKGRKSVREDIKYPVTSLDLFVGLGCNYFYAHVYDYEDYDGYKMVNIGYVNNTERRYSKFQGERKLALAPVFLLVSSIIRKRINSLMHEEEE